MDAAYTPAATARAELLENLCGRYAFLSFDQVIQAELGVLVNPSSAPALILSNEGNWFPNLDDVMPRAPLSSMPHDIDQMGKEQGMSRIERRKLKRKLFKNDQPTSTTRAFLAKAKLEYDEVLKSYPMRPEDAKVMAEYVLGRNTREAAQDALLNSLRDPHWMMQWFATRHEMLTPVVQWLREPARTMGEAMKSLAEQVAELRRSATILGHDHELKSFLAPAAWLNSKNEILANIAKRLLIHYYPDSEIEIDAAALDLSCPGLSTAIRSLHSSLYTAMSEKPRTPMESDFVDAIHAMYAPYTNLFRADRYIAPHIRKHTAKYGTQVVSRLDELPARIRDLAGTQI